MIGYPEFYEQIASGLKPDLDLTVDEWSDQFMIIPKATGSNEYGPYRTQRTPHAREIMRCLSDDHPCKRVIAKVASQMFKTQLCLNWLGASIHQSPSNFLWLMPTGALAKRISGRIDKTIKAVDVLRERVAKPNSRDAKNNQDVKEYTGGSLFIATAGSAANLSEVPARRVAIDEIDRGEENVDGEGDPVKLAEARQTTFEHNRKSYYYSSPTIEGESRIDELFKQGTQRHALAECIHCGHAQDLIFERLVSMGNHVAYPCSECGGLHVEADKNKMFEKGLWSEPVIESENESFTASAMFLPYGWKSWDSLYKDHAAAKKLLEAGDESEMIVFYNTRLARCWERQKEATKHDVLMQRAEDYRLGTVPMPVCILTAAIDTQADRLEIKVVGWGAMMECWIVDYRVIIGDPAEFDTWQRALDVLTSKYRHESGTFIDIANAKFVDSGGHHTQEVYNFCRKHKSKGFFPIKGSSKPNFPIIPNKPSNPDFNYKGQVLKKAVSLWQIGTDTAKDYLYARWKRDSGQGAVHFSADLPEEYFKQLVSEYRTVKYINGYKKSMWEKKQSERNEALDLMVYNLAAAHKLGLHRLTENQWQSKAIQAPEKPVEEIEIIEEDLKMEPEIINKKPKFKRAGRFNPNAW